MDFTNYFHDEGIESLKTTLYEMLTKLDEALSYNSESQDHYSVSAWISRVKNPLLDGLKNNEVLINNIKNQIQIFLNSLTYAEKIVEIQNKMKSTDENGNYELDEHDIYGGSAEIERQIHYFYEEISKMSTSIDLSKNISSYVNNSNELRFDIQLFDKANHMYANNYVSSTRKLYDLAMSLTSFDDCLRYGINVLCYLCNFLYYRSMFIEDLVYNYRNNIVVDLDNNLPETDNLILTVWEEYAKDVTLITNNYSLPNIEEYVKDYSDADARSNYFSKLMDEYQETHDEYYEKHKNGELTDEEMGAKYDEYIRNRNRARFEKDSKEAIKCLESYIIKNEETLGPSHGYAEGRGCYGSSENLFNLYKEFLDAMKDAGQDIEPNL